MSQVGRLGEVDPPRVGTAVLGSLWAFSTGETQVQAPEWVSMC